MPGVPTELISNKPLTVQKSYLWYQAFKNVWFVAAIWLLYYRLFVSDQQIGIMDAISFGIGLLAEIPAGALADHLGRKKLIIIGVFMGGVGMALQGLAVGYELILIGQVIVSAGWALSSGADDAFFYDAVDSELYRKNWKQLLVKGSRLTRIVSLVSYLVGGYMFVVSPRLPFIAMGILSLGAAFAVLPIADTSVKVKQSAGDFLTRIKSGIAQLNHKKVRNLIPIIILVQGFYYVFGFGLVRPILQSKFGYSASGGAWLIAGCSLLAYIVQTMQARFLHKLSANIAMVGIVGVSAAALLAATLSLGLWGGICIAAIYTAEYTIEPWISDGINTYVASAHRATTLSAAAFLRALPYVLLAPIIGYANTHNMFNTYLLVTSLSLIVALALYLRMSKPNYADE